MLDAQGVVDLLLELDEEWISSDMQWLGEGLQVWRGTARGDELAALHWWAERTEPSARSPSVLEHYATLTSRAFDLGFVVVGR